MPTLIAPVPAFGPALPEIVLALGTLALILVGAYRGDRAQALIEGAALALIAIVALMVLTQPSGRVVTFNGAFVVDAFARFMKVAALIGSGVTLAMSAQYWREEKLQRFEYPILILLSTLGMMMMVSANDLIALYLGLELTSLALYVLAAFRRDDVRSTEAGLKYFVLGALSSGMLLYGASLIYGFTGAIGFGAIADALKSEQGTGVIFGLVFLLAGLAFKMSAVPFHMWTPDVYEGAPTPVTAFFAAAPKLAAVALTVRVVIQAFPAILSQWQQIIVFIAIASMALGAFAAIGQRNIKRLMAYSSIGNMGYALVGLSAGTPAGVQGVAIYMTIYLVMTLGTFGCILAMRRAGGYVEDIEDLSGLGRVNPAMAFVLAMLLFSLAGIPPLAGFFAKWYVFAAAVEARLYGLAIIGVLASAVSAFYYIRIVKIMYFDEERAPFEPMSAALQGVTAISGAFMVLFFLWPGPLVSAATAAAKSLF